MNEQKTTKKLIVFLNEHYTTPEHDMLIHMMIKENDRYNFTASEFLFF